MGRHVRSVRTGRCVATAVGGVWLSHRSSRSRWWCASDRPAPAGVRACRPARSARAWWRRSRHRRPCAPSTTSPETWAGSPRRRSDQNRRTTLLAHLRPVSARWAATWACCLAAPVWRSCSHARRQSPWRVCGGPSSADTAPSCRRGSRAVLRVRQVVVVAGCGRHIGHAPVDPDRPAGRGQRLCLRVGARRRSTTTGPSGSR